ncbi:YlxR family protein [Propioniferax innocua]|uniref:YlxR family protein n=1 Tax=Propioniferax innocua TaxID=1753 RepID=UPI001B8635C4|nr:YlxR family protein [Propioniferax innocua]
MNTPIRTCVGCRRTEPVQRLVRFVALEGVLVVDDERRIPGRGAHLHRDEAGGVSLACARQALRKRAMPRALRVSVLDCGVLENVPPDAR